MIPALSIAALCLTVQVCARVIDQRRWRFVAHLHAEAIERARLASLDADARPTLHLIAGGVPYADRRPTTERRSR